MELTSSSQFITIVHNNELYSGYCKLLFLDYINNVSYWSGDEPYKYLRHFKTPSKIEIFEGGINLYSTNGKHRLKIFRNN
jgi:hypothetical protein